MDEAEASRKVAGSGDPGDAAASPPSTRAGYVALVGRPNVGKSTLMNALVGEKLSIVTPRAQTTRERVTGILSRAGTQMIFVDTPGLLEPRYLLQEWMLEQALRALEDADAVLLLVDATRPQELPAEEVLARLRAAAALVVAVNKTDVAGARTGANQLVAWAAETLPAASVLQVSAATATGLDALVDALESALPASPFFFPEDEIAIQPVRFFVAELIRETLFEVLEEEVPYSTAVQVEEFREAASPVYIRATIYVERESQKGIVVGARGAGVRAIGSASRRKIESFLDVPVYLDLWVKAKPGWRRKRSGLEDLGYEKGRDDR